MVAYSFKRYFAPQIETGFKRQTIRADRARHARPGEMVQLFVGMRTRHCAKIRPDVACESVSPVQFEFDHGTISRIRLGDRDLIETEMEEFARQDGFAPEHFNEPSGYRAATALENMDAFWLENHGESVFEGVLIRWTP